MKITRFGQTVEKLQAQHGISNKELAQKLGVTASRVSFMKAARKPHPMTVHKLSKVFKVDVAIFFGCD